MILDGNDPSGLGIFSKVGRQLTEKIPMLSKRKPHKEISQEYSQTQPLEPTQMTPNKHLSQRPQPFSVGLSREKRQDHLRPRNNNPVVGQYRFELSERPKMVWDYMDAYRKAQKNLEGAKQRRGNTQEPTEVNVSTELFDSMNNRSVGHIDMSKMLGRADMRQRTIFPQHKMEIDTSENPELHDVTSSIRLNTKTSQKGMVQFNKQLSREKVNRLKQVSAFFYDCNHEYLKQNLGRVGPQFNKLTGRKTVLNPNYTMSSSTYNYDDYVWKGESSIYPKTRKGNVIFARQTTRYGREETQGTQSSHRYGLTEERD